MNAPSVIDDATLAKARDLLHRGKKVGYITTRLNVESAVIIEAGFGHGLRYDKASDTMTARPLALDIDPNAPSAKTLELGQYRKATETPARLLPPRPRTPADPKTEPASRPAPIAPPAAQPTRSIVVGKREPPQREKFANNIPAPTAKRQALPPVIGRVSSNADLERCYDRVCADIADTRDRLRDLLIVQQALHTLLPRRSQ